MIFGFFHGTWPALFLLYNTTYRGGSQVGENETETDLQNRYTYKMWVITLYKEA